MAKLNCIIIEDEPLAIKMLSGYIANVPFLQLTGTFRDSVSAAAHLQLERPDLIFLDIHLPGIKGLELLRTIADRPAVIISSAYPDYALEGYDLSVADYLLKPYSHERFLAAVSKVHSYAQRQPEKDYFFLNVRNRKIKVDFDDILYVESQREYVRIITTEQAYTTRLSTNEIEQLLPATQFKRIHRSYIVSVDKVTAYNADHVEINGTSLPIGRSYRKKSQDL